MGPKEKTVVWGAALSFLVNFVIHSYVLAEALISVPLNLIAAAFVTPFFPVWMIVVFGLFKRRKWGFQLGLVISLTGVVVSVGGILTALTPSMVDALLALIVDLIQIGFCTYGLKRISW